MTMPATQRQPDAVLLLRIQTVNPLNSRRHWRTVWKTGEREKIITATAFLLHLAKGGTLPELPVDVRLVRVSPHHTPMDEDGLAASLKHVRDQVAIELGASTKTKDWKVVALDGRKDLVKFEVDQEPGPDFRVRVELYSRVA